MKMGWMANSSEKTTKKNPKSTKTVKNSVKTVKKAVKNRRKLMAKWRKIDQKNGAKSKNGEILWKVEKNGQRKAKNLQKPDKKDEDSAENQRKFMGNLFIKICKKKDEEPTKRGI